MVNRAIEPPLPVDEPLLASETDSPDLLQYDNAIRNIIKTAMTKCAAFMLKLF